MQMKSLLALSVLVSAVFLTGISNAQSDPATAEQAAENQPAMDQAATEAQAEPRKAKKASKRHKHKHKRKHRRHSHVEHRHMPLEQRLAPHYIWSDHRAPCHNFLVGGTLSYAVRDLDFDSTFEAPLTFPGIPVSVSRNYIDNGVMFGLFGGWQWRINRFMLGAEVNVDFQDFEKTEAFALSSFDPTPPLLPPLGLSGTLLYDRGDAYSLTARFGYFVTPFFLPYVRAGAQFSRDEVSYQASVFPGPLVDFSSEKKDVWGWILGVGMEFPTYIGASTIRVEYNIIQTETITIGDGVLPIIGSHEFDHPNTHVGRISWVWNFL